MTKKKRLALARAAQKAARERRARAEAEEKAAVAYWLSGATRRVGDPLPGRSAVSSTERSHAFRARGREITIPRVRHRRVRERYRFDLLGFGLVYCVGEYDGMKKPLLKRPPSPRMIRFVLKLQDKILHGGLKHVRWPRGKGKSTWVKIAILWAALYGHKSFMVVVEKVKGMAFVVVDEIWKRIYLSPRISADFPEFAVPMRDVEMAPQRMRVQTYLGAPTYMKQDISKFHYYKLPTMKGMPWTGAMIAYRGADQALRGINIDSTRPDFFFIDDPQTDEDAANPETVAKIEDNISGAVLGSGETSERISAVMASTPIEPDDVSERFADPKRHPEWETETETFVVYWGDEKLRDEYIAALERADACPNDDAERKAELQEYARKFYEEHRADIERGAEMMDDGDFDPATEVSAYQHALWLMHTMKPKRFYSEMQMQPTRSQGIYKIDPQTVSKRVNGFPLGVVPPECDRGILAFCDVNDDAGLRWELGAFGAGRRLATLAYGQYPPGRGGVIPPGVPSSAIPEYLAPALRKVADTILAQRFVDRDGHPLPIDGICFDGGWQTETVATVAQEYRDKGVPVVWSKGFNSKQYSRYLHEKAAKLENSKNNPSGLKAREECHLWETMNGVYLAFNADYWKEISQTSFLRDPLSSSSSSLWGESDLTHFRFAQEVCAEQLVAKEDSVRYGGIWTWKKDRGTMNHYGDTHAGLLAYGAIRDYFDPVVSVVSGELMKRIASRRRTRYVIE